MIRPGPPIRGTARVPGDKSIAHRWLVLAATARGRSVLRGLPASLDVASTAKVLAAVAPRARGELREWATRAHVEGDDVESAVEVEGAGREGLVAPEGVLECGNSGTTMRLVAGVVASAPFRTVMTGDDSLLRRPMERVAEPLRAMGARVETNGGRPPIVVAGARLTGIRWTPPVPSAQVKSAILLAGLAADGETEVTEAVPTRDHTERALRALDAPVEWRDGVVRLTPFQQEGFAGEVPGDLSSAAFLVAAAALTASEVTIRDVGLNPSRIRFLEVLRRMGIETTTRVERIELGEPVGEIVVHAPTTVRGTRVPAEEFPLVHDESPVLAMVASHAESESRFEGAGELRVKEADRLSGIAEGIRELGGEATVEDDALVVAGGGLAGGRADARGDHRLAMAFAVAALAARGTSEVTGIEWARVSFPGFDRILRSLGGDIEVGR